MPPGKLTNAVSIAVAFLVPGTVINSPVFDSEGTLLVEAKTPITREIIEDLRKTGLTGSTICRGRHASPTTARPGPETIHPCWTNASWLWRTMFTEIWPRGECLHPDHGSALPR